jgi:hypothetical protein
MTHVNIPLSSPEMSYSSIDSILNRWTKQHSLTLYTQHQDCEVRSVDVVDKVGDKFQIWIDKPIDSFVSVHAWDYKRKRQDWKTEGGKLDEILNEALAIVKSWGAQTAK